MSWSGSRLIVALILALTLALATSQSSLAQRPKGEEGTGGAAGYSPPPLDSERSMGAPAPTESAQPPPSDDSAAQPEPEDMPPVDENTPTENKNDGGQPAEPGPGADVPD